MGQKCERCGEEYSFSESFRGALICTECERREKDAKTAATPTPKSRPHFSRCFKWTFFLAIGIQVLLWIAYLAWCFVPPSHGGMYQRRVVELFQAVVWLYGGPLIEWFGDHFARSEADVGIGWPLFFAIAPFFMVLYALIAAFVMGYIRRIVERLTKSL
jgi:hypothetical protein